MAGPELSASASTVTDRRRLQGQRTRAAILGVAVDLASQHGLESLSIGTLAQATELSKSGLFGHFGSREELQLATVEVARERFADEVVRPALGVQAGIRRVWSLCDRWLEYAEGEVFPGGCFFAQTSVEFNNRPGVVRDRIAAIMAEWTDEIESAIERALELGEIKDSRDSSRLSFVIQALLMGAHWDFQLQHRRQVFSTARQTALEQLELVLTAKGRRRLPPLVN